MRILIFGAGGFIGGQLKACLEDFFDVTAPTSKEVNLLKIDDISKLGNDFDVVINSATTFNRGQECLDDIVMDNILSVFPDCRHVYLGTMSETSKTGLIMPSDGEPKTDYGRKKFICSQKLCENSVQYMNLRLFGVFGSGEGQSRLVPSIIRTLSTKRPMVLSRGTQIRDFINVQVVVKCIEHILHEDMFSCETTNIGSGRGISIKNLIYSVSKNAEIDLFQFDLLPDKVTDTDGQIADLTQTVTQFPDYINYLEEVPCVIKYINGHL